MQLQAQDATWNQTGTGSWFDVDNWTPNGQVPDNNTSVYFHNLSGTAVIGSGDAFAGSLYVGDHCAGGIIIDAGASLTTSQGAIFGFNGAGSMTVSGVWTHYGSEIYFGDRGDEIEGVGFITVSECGKVFFGDSDAKLGLSQNTFGTAVIDGYWQSRDLIIGGMGEGSMTVGVTGSVFSTGNVKVGAEFDGQGNVTISGYWEHSFQEFTVGDRGAGTLTVSAGGTLITTGETFVGRNVDGVGEVVVDGYWQGDNSLQVGRDGEGKLTVSGTMQVHTTINVGVGGGGGNLTLGGNALLQADYLSMATGTVLIASAGVRLQNFNGEPLRIYAGSDNASIVFDHHGYLEFANVIDSYNNFATLFNSGTTALTAPATSMSRDFYGNVTVSAGATLLIADNFQSRDFTVSAGGALDLRDIANPNALVNPYLFGNVTLLGTLRMTLGDYTFSDQIYGCYGDLILSGALELDLIGEINYGKAKYLLFDRFNSITITDLTISGYDTENWQAVLSADGLLTFQAIPEPSAWMLLLPGATLVLTLRRWSLCHSR